MGWHPRIVPSIRRGIEASTLSHKARDGRLALALLAWYLPAPRHSIYREAKVLDCLSRLGLMCGL